MAGCAAMLEIDIKKVIALSTLSQLGIMIIVIGAGAPILAYFHLLSHSIFKRVLLKRRYFRSYNNERIKYTYNIDYISWNFFNCCLFMSNEVFIGIKLSKI